MKVAIIMGSKSDYPVVEKSRKRCWIISEWSMKQG